MTKFSKLQRYVHKYINALLNPKLNCEISKVLFPVFMKKRCGKQISIIDKMSRKNLSRQKISKSSKKLHNQSATHSSLLIFFMRADPENVIFDTFNTFSMRTSEA